MSILQSVIYSILILGLLSVSVQTWMLVDTLAEINTRQRDVIAPQHKAIEAKITAVCAR
jgi:hypothetical protein